MCGAGDVSDEVLDRCGDVCDRALREHDGFRWPAGAGGRDAPSGGAACHDWEWRAGLIQQCAHVDRIDARHAPERDREARANSRNLPFDVCRIDGAYQRARSPRPEEGGVGIRNAPAQICPRPGAAPILECG